MLEAGDESFKPLNEQESKSEELPPIESTTGSTESGVKKYLDFIKNYSCRIVSFEIQQNDTLLDLKNTLHSQPQVAGLTSSIHNLRIRGFKGHLPGKVYGATDQSLKKLGIVSDRSMVFQIMNSPEPFLSSQTMLLQVFLCKLSSADSAAWSPYPIEVLWDPQSDV